MKVLIYILLALLITLVVYLNFGATSDDIYKTITITGSSTIAPFAAEIAKKFEKLNPSIRVDIQTGGSSRGISDTRSGVADIGMVSRSQSEGEKELNFFTIAIDGICIIVNKDNPVKSLTNKQVMAIYTGMITNWKQVGSFDKKITVVNKAEGRSTLEVFLKYFAIKNSEIDADIIIGDNEQGIKTVAGLDSAIGYVSVGTAEFNVNDGTTIKMLPLNGIVASIENIKNGTFPLSRKLNFITRGELDGNITKFISFALSNRAHDIIESHYFIPARQE